MTVTSGFFNSVNHDRKYNAEEISSIFDGIILDGVYQGFGEALKVSGTSTANQVKIGSGRAWFNHTWTLNDEALYLTIPSGNSTYPRIDAIVLEVNNDTSVRQNSIKCVTGTAASSPQRPTLTKTSTVHQYPLAYINRPKGTSNTISASDIENKIGSAECPIVTGVLEVLDDDRFIAQTIANLTDDFNKWFEGIKGMLDEDAATSLANRILELQKYVDTKISAVYSMFESFAIGNNLGSSITQDQLNAIKNGTFSGKFGDYWYINGNVYMIIGIDDFYDTSVNADTKGRHHLTILASLVSKLSETTNPTVTDTIMDSNVAVGSDRYSKIVSYQYHASKNVGYGGMMESILFPYEKLVEPHEKYINYIKQDIGDICLSYPLWTNDGFVNIKQIPVYYSYAPTEKIEKSTYAYPYTGYTTTSPFSAKNKNPKGLNKIFDIENSKLPFKNEDMFFNIQETINSLNGFWSLLSDKSLYSILYKRIQALSDKTLPENNKIFVYSASDLLYDFTRYAQCFDRYGNGNAPSYYGVFLDYGHIYTTKPSLYTPVKSPYNDKYLNYHISNNLIYNLEYDYSAGIDEKGVVPLTALYGFPMVTTSLIGSENSITVTHYDSNGAVLTSASRNPTDYAGKYPYSTAKTKIVNNSITFRPGSILICI